MLFGLLMILEFSGNRGFLTSSGLLIRYRDHILLFLDATQVPRALAMIKIQGNSFWHMKNSKDKHLAESAAKSAALNNTPSSVMTVLIQAPSLHPVLKNLLKQHLKKVLRTWKGKLDKTRLYL